MKLSHELFLAEFLAQISKQYIQPLYLDGMSLLIDYRTIQLNSIPKRSIPVLLLTGFGSGWEGIVPLAFSLACRGYRVVLLSLPGYGNSENPPPRYYKQGLYWHHGQAALAVLKSFGISEAYFIGHSMGAEILAKAAKSKRIACKKLVMLHPSGIKTVSGLGKIGLFWRFTLSGSQLRLEHRSGLDGCDSFIDKLADFCDMQKSPWKGRLGQRRAEFAELCKGGLIQTLQEVSSDIIFISGSRDTVFNPIETIQLLRSALGAGVFTQRIIKGNLHNPTLYNAEKTAAVISEMLEKT